MTATTLLEAFQVSPNSGLKVITLAVPNTTDENDTLAVTLADYGISATGLLVVESWKHTTDGSVIVTELNTCAVSAGVLTVTIAAGTTDDMRVIQIIGRADPGVYA